MPPKKKENKAKDGEVVEGEDPIQFLKNYTMFCKSAGLAPNPTMAKTLNDEEKYPIEQLVIDDEHGPMGPGGTRALMTAVLGGGPGMKGGPYKLLKFIRLWKCHVGDDGAASIAEVLRLGGGDVKIAYLELLDDEIGPRGVGALGMSLSQGRNLSLLTLNLDFNTLIGSQGAANLCRGLRTNTTLKQLHMNFCKIGPEAGADLAGLLANARSGLEKLKLQGNMLGGQGLEALSKGLLVNTTLQEIVLADNLIDQGPEDMAGLEQLRECLLAPTSGLTTVSLLYNRIGEAGAQILAPALTPANTKITEFLVDATLPMPIFEQLIRRGGGGGKKKGKKGKKK